MGSRGIRGAGRTLALLGSALALAACTAATAPRETYGQTRFVSLNPCVDAMLVDIAEPEQILALSHYSRDPASSSMDVERAKRFGVTGGSAEEVIALEPDVVLASAFIDPATRRALENAGLRVETFGSPVSVEDSLAQVRELAAVVGKPENGEAMVERIEAAIPAQAGEGTAVSGMLWQPGEIVAGETSLVWDLFSRTGLVSHASAMGLGQADHVTLEQLAANPPDLLLIAGDARGQAHPVLAELGPKTRVARFEPTLFYCGGPSIIKAWERLEEITSTYRLHEGEPGA